MKLVFGLALACVILAALTSLVDPLVIRFTLDSVLARLSGVSCLARNLWLCGLALLAASFASALFSSLRGSLSAVAAEHNTKNLRDRLAPQLDAAPASYFCRASAWDLVPPLRRPGVVDHRRCGGAWRGRTDSGKATLVAAVVRLVEPSSGSIRLDGVVISLMYRRNLREMVDLVLQEPGCFFDPATDLARVIADIQYAQASAERAVGLIETDLTRSGERWRLRGEVEFEGAGFSYEGTCNVLTDFSLRVEPRQTVAIIGETGSGKPRSSTWPADSTNPLLAGHSSMASTTESCPCPFSTEATAMCCSNPTCFSGRCATTSATEN